MPWWRGSWRAGGLLLFLFQASCAISEDPSPENNLRAVLPQLGGDDRSLISLQGAGVLLAQDIKQNQESLWSFQGAIARDGHLLQPTPRRALSDASTAQPPTGASAVTQLSGAAPSGTLASHGSPWHAVQRLADDADLLRTEQLQKHLKPWLVTASSGSPGQTAESPGAVELEHRWESLGRPLIQMSTAEWEHNDLLRWDNQTLARFGSPVMGFSRLDFHASLESQKSVNVRKLRTASRCPPSSCPKFEPCQIRDSALQLSTCDAPSHHAGLSNINTALKLRNVYISGTGVVFNRSTTFNFDDCSLGKEKRYQVHDGRLSVSACACTIPCLTRICMSSYKCLLHTRIASPRALHRWHVHSCLQAAHNHSAGDPVLHVRRAFSLIHQWGRNFFHNMIEVLPAFFSLAELLAEDPGLPILLRGTQVRHSGSRIKVISGAWDPCSDS